MNSAVRRDQVINDDYRTLRIKFASVGSDRGKSKNRERSWRKFLEEFNAPLEQKGVTFAEYFKLKKTAGQKTDNGRPTAAAKKANDKLNGYKNVAGSFVAGHFEDGTRKKSSLMFRSMVCLDIDECTPEQFKAVKAGEVLISRYAQFYYTTRSHTPEKPKFRLVLPLTEEIDDPVKMEALTRYLCRLVDPDPTDGLAMTDAVSFRWNQIMYMPSISVNQPYESGEIEGEVLDADEFLADIDWEDVSEWPIKDTENDARLGTHGTKMENPREKEGLIGAFCRVYDVESAIAEFIPEVYSQSSDQSSARPRYDYVPGSGHSGCEVYEDGLFFQSYHGTDPAEGQHNAWDLVRSHKFGHLDDKAHANTSAGNMPSFKAMNKLAQSLADVVAEKNAHLIQGFDDDDEDEQPSSPPKAKADDSDLDLGDDDDDDFTLDDNDIGSRFDDDDEPEPKQEKKKADATDLEWTQHLRTKANGELDTAVINATLIFQHDVRLKDCIGYNEFTFDPVCLKQIKSRRKALPLPSDPVMRADRLDGRQWEDSDDSALNILCSAGPTLSGYSTDFSTRTIQDAVIAAGKENRVHPVKRFIERCHEDWKSRRRNQMQIDRLFTDYLGCPDTPFHREAAYWLLVGAVARIYEPGCKFDTMAIIEGPTGSGKSTFWEYLFGGWVTELKCRLDDTARMVETMRGNWAIEMAEMEAAKKADSNTLKMMLSSTADQHRLAYAKREGRYKRQSVFVGTSNEDDYLTDPTSSRRYWVLRTEKDELDMIDKDLLQASLWAIWGEAYQEYLDLRAKQPKGALHLDLKSREAIQERDRIAEGSRKKHASEVLAETVQDWLDEPVPGDEIVVDPDKGIPDEYAEARDDQRFVRNMVTAEMAFLACHDKPALRTFRSLDMRQFGKALAQAEGWEYLGRKHRHGKKAHWYARGSAVVEDEAKNAPLALPAAEFDDDLDDLL
ncbi:MAG: virulence-associated E family protein [Pseudomonadota bacterium]